MMSLTITTFYLNKEILLIEPISNTSDHLGDLVDFTEFLVDLPSYSLRSRGLPASVAPLKGGMVTTALFSCFTEFSDLRS